MSIFRLTSIRSVANRAREARKSDGAPSNAWEENDTFLVCIYNVSPEIPYAILKVLLLLKPPISAYNCGIFVGAFKCLRPRRSGTSAAKSSSIGRPDELCDSGRTGMGRGLSQHPAARS